VWKQLDCALQSKQGLDNKEMKLLLAMKPEYANAILEGTKKYEFRRRMWQKIVETVYIYASSPIKKVIGEFKINRLLFGRLDAIWLQTKDSAGINFDEFQEYFHGLKYGWAIEIGEVRKYEKSLSLDFFGLNKPPQLFTYLLKGYIEDDEDKP